MSVQKQHANTVAKLLAEHLPQSVLIVKGSNPPRLSKRAGALTTALVEAMIEADNAGFMARGALTVRRAVEPCEYSSSN